MTQLKTKPKAIKPNIKHARSKSIEKELSAKLSLSEDEMETACSETEELNLIRKEDQSSVKKVKQFYENLCKAKDAKLETIRMAHQRRYTLFWIAFYYKLIRTRMFILD